MASILWIFSVLAYESIVVGGDEMGGVKPLEARSVGGLLRLQKEAMKRANAIYDELRAVEKELNARGWYMHYDYCGGDYGWKEGKPKERKAEPRVAGRVFW